MLAPTIEAWQVVDELVGTPCSRCGRAFAEGDLYVRVRHRLIPFAREIVCLGCWLPVAV